MGRDPETESDDVPPDETNPEMPPPYPTIGLEDAPRGGNPDGAE
jgi:hypothetical protein